MGAAEMLQPKHTWTSYINHIIADEISLSTKYYDQVIHWLPRREDNGTLLYFIESPNKVVINENDNFPDLTGEKDKRTAVLLNGVLNYDYDIEGLMLKLKPSLARTSRIILVMYNPYLSWLYRIANLLKLRAGPIPTTYITRHDLYNLVKLTGLKIVRTRTVAYFPWKLFGIGDFINHLLSITPILKWLSFSYIATLQPVVAETGRKPSLSCIIPARNERGNIENILARIPDLQCELEIIFVEGNSTDNTWDEIIRVTDKYKNKFNIKAFQQSGIGKGDAVRLGFSKASGELLTILDADLTMPPEFLGRYYNAYCNGLADFINGSRLVYPMEGEAMRFLNRLGNRFFANVLSKVLDTRIGDALCGTKLLAKHDYKRMIAWRNDFGDFDPFGDFELLFAAAVLCLGIVDIPIRYRSRTYGDTNISRFRHGLILLKMTIIGFKRIKLAIR